MLEFIILSGLVDKYEYLLKYLTQIVLYNHRILSMLQTKYVAISFRFSGASSK